MILASTTLLLTIIGALAVGIVAGYGAVLAVLHALSPKPPAREEAPAKVLAATPSSSS